MNVFFEVKQPFPEFARLYMQGDFVLPPHLRQFYTSTFTKMTMNIKSRLSLLTSTIFILFFSLNARSQATGIEITPEIVHYGPVEGGTFDFDGYITYKIWVTFDNDEDFLTSIFSTFDDPDMYMQSTGDVYNNDEFGGYVATEVNDLLFATFPDLAYDTWWTIGAENGFSSGCSQVLISATDPDDGNLTNPNEDVFVDGLVYNLITDGCGHAGLNEPGKVLIGQITTNGDLCVRVNTQIQLECIPGTDFTLQQFWEEVCLPNPCTNAPFENAITVLDDIPCFGDLASIDVGGGGNGNVVYELYEVGSDTPISQTNDQIFTDLEEGDYYVAYSDDIGCLDTSNVFSFVEPPLLEVTPELTLDNSCFGEDVADFCIETQGGTGDLSIVATDACGTEFNASNDGCFEDLSCCEGSGAYTWIVEDENGCNETGAFAVACPLPLIIDITTTDAQCFEECDGIIEGTVSGGTGLLNPDWDAEEISDPSPNVSFVDIDYDDICAGTYTLEVTDNNGCTADTTVTIDEPELLEVDFEVVHASCFSFCDGSIEAFPFGGVGPYDFVCQDEDGVIVEPINLCAGTYECIITDDQDCVLTVFVEVTEPTEITYDLIANNVSCNAECNGSICIENLVGGCDASYELVLTTSEGVINQEELCFETLCSGEFDLQIIDDCSCSVETTGIVLVEPDPIVVTPDITNVQCLGFGNGMVDFSAEGGTGPISLSPDNLELPLTIDSLLAQNYTFEFTDSLGCSTSLDVTITEPEELILELLQSADPACGGECSGIVFFQAEGGNGNYDYIYNNSQADDIDADPFNMCADDAWELIVVDSLGCMDTITFALNEPNPIEITIDWDDVTCTGMTDGNVTVIANGGSGDVEHVVVFADDVDAELDLDNLQEGEYCIIATDQISNCVTDSCFLIEAEIVTDMTLTMFVTPLSCWNTSDGTATAGVAGGTEPITYLWNDIQAQTTQTAVGLTPEFYSVVVVDSLGCTLSGEVEVVPSEGCFFIADALTPNNDGANDTWVVGGLEYFPESKVTVFNRWGQLLFESIGYDFEWDGRFNGNKLPVADYYYIITYHPDFEPITGTVTIKY